MKCDKCDRTIPATESYYRVSKEDKPYRICQHCVKGKRRANYDVFRTGVNMLLTCMKDINLDEMEGPDIEAAKEFIAKLKEIENG